MTSGGERPAGLLEVENLTVTYALPSQGAFGRRRSLAAVDGVDLSIGEGESVGLVGETGCGKSSLARALCGLTRAAGGRIRFRGVDIAAVGGAERRALRRDMHMIFQDPGGSLNPRLRAGKIVAEPLEIHRAGDRRRRRRQARRMLEAVGLAAADAERFPHEFSGGQRQRIAIARALAVKPRLILADEPVSALDVSLQAQILNLIQRLRREVGSALLFVSHDLSVVRHLCDRVAVMYLGRIVESGPARTVFDAPRHPYTRELVASSPVPDPKRPIQPPGLSADPPNPAAPPAGCRYHPRCPHATSRCAAVVPELRIVEEGRQAACHFAERLRETEAILP